MTELEEGADTIVDQCLKIQEDEDVVIVTDGVDRGITEALRSVLDRKDLENELLEYEEVENHGEEPPEHVAERMKEADVVIAPTNKSLSHTHARGDANEAGTRVASMPTITREIWGSSLQADYHRIEEITEKAHGKLAETDEVRVKTPSGTDLTLRIEPEHLELDTGLIHEPGDFGNLPAGETFGPAIAVNGTLVIDHTPIVDGAEGIEIEIEDSEVVAVRGPETELQRTFEEVENARKLAEFGFGTNPEAHLIGNVLQDEKSLGTVHFAFGDNTFFIPEGHEYHSESEVHWDFVSENPTVWFDDEKVLDEGEPVFLE
ncbi:MAG: aminopeptidase [Candidatus Nanohaloarchaea archaeon]